MKSLSLLLAGFAAVAASAQPLPITTTAPKTLDPVALSIRAINQTPLEAPAPPMVALPIKPTWTLHAGKTVGDGLREWAAKANWTVVWNLPKDWMVPSDTNFHGDFADAAEQAITTLAANGALIRATINEANNTLVVFGPGVTQK